MFESISNNTISVNVYGVDPIRTSSIVVNKVTKIQRPSCHINLLSLENARQSPRVLSDVSAEASRSIRDENNNHYVLIKDLSRLIGAQTNKKN